MWYELNPKNGEEFSVLAWQGRAKEIEAKKISNCLEYDEIKDDVLYCIGPNDMELIGFEWDGATHTNLGYLTDVIDGKKYGNVFNKNELFTGENLKKLVKNLRDKHDAIIKAFPDTVDDENVGGIELKNASGWRSKNVCHSHGFPAYFWFYYVYPTDDGKTYVKIS